MAVAAKFLCLLLVLSPAASYASEQEVVQQNHANPMRKVVTMLQMMTSKINAAAAKEEELFDKFMCYCKGGKGTLASSIEAAKTKISDLKSSIDTSSGEKAQTEVDLRSHRADRDAAKSAMDQATGVRAKEAKEYASASADLKTNIAAMGKAITSVEKGVGGSFLQTETAKTVKNFVMMSENIADIDREDLLSFLSAKQGEGYAPQSGQIVGIMKQLGDDMEKSLAEATSSEEAAIATYKELMAAKTKQVETLTTMIEEKSVRLGDLGVEVATMKNDLDDTSEALEEDSKFLADMDTMCATKEKEWDERCKLRSEELLALTDTIKILNDDDALELFKKTLPGASSFLQVRVQAKAMRKRALALLAGDKRFDFIALALHGKSKGFGMVIGMIDGMIETLKKEQGDDDAKKEYCNTKFDEADDAKKSAEQAIADLDTAIADAEEAIATFKTEIEALSDGIRALDKSVADATEQRKEENEDFNELITSNTACKELIGVAKNRLQKFYNPKLYKPPASGAAMLLQIRAHSQKDAPAPPPETFGEYKKSEESGGVMAMLDAMVADLDKEMQEAKVDEKDAQKEYEKTMADSAEKRAEDAKTLTDKESAKASTEASLQQKKQDKMSKGKELGETMKYIAGLHGECDWLLQYFDQRKEARVGEIDSLDKAKATLNGADFSLVQTASRSRRQAPEDELAKEMTHDLEMNFNKIAPFGKEDTAKELQDHAAKTQDTLVDAVENAEVAEIKRAVFRALTRLRAATIKEFDTIARLETQAIDAYNDAHHYRAENPLTHLHEDEAPVETDKLKSFH